MIKSKIIGVFLFAFLVSGCSSNDPSEDDISKALAESLPGFVELTSINVKAMENVGSKIEPRFSSRFVGKISSLKPTYEKIGHIGGNVDSDVLRLVMEKDTELDIYGKAESVLEKEKWNTKIKDLDIDVNNSGYLKSKFIRPVIEGSAGHATAINKYEAWKKEKAAAQEIVRKKKERILTEYATAFSGKWKGEYICIQGVTGVTLTLTSTNTGISAIFDFYPTKENPGAKSGSFMLSGVFNDNGDFKLSPTRWIKQPEGYRAVGMKGRISDDRKKLSGAITKLRACSLFSLDKL